VIWHFLEVWALLVVVFAAGCPLGALLYGLLADSPLALVQGDVADSVGDFVEWGRTRLGLSPDWRPQLVRSVPRSSPSTAVEPQDYVDELSDPDEWDFAAVESEDDWREPGPTEIDAEIDEPEIAAPTPQIVPPRPAPLLPAGDPGREASATVVGSDGVVPMRPAGLSRPRAGVPDNLTRIRGIGHRNEELLNSLGIFHFGQIASWTPGEVRWIGQYLAFPERIERDDWVGQAMIFATGGDTGFEKSADRRRQRRAALRQQAAEGPAALPPGGDDWSDADDRDGDSDGD
jgi:predicted flap endonuclease-1-like 5' DNA nuclease